MASTSSGQDSVVVDGLVNYIKSAGLFDQFRRDCLADVDTKPAYQNLRQRVEGYVSNFLSQHTWSPNLNKNQLRDSLRRQINQSEMLSTGVERIVEQVVEPQIQHVFRPQIEKAFNEYVEKKKGDAESRKDEELPNKTEEISVPMVTSEKVESTCKSELSALPTSTGSCLLVMFC
uniref:Biorientation of chromosomes in cell division protein 1-like 1-like n=1 Tax=Saccoglossus kowalevskii TaxID=10224 RepID=A0ABM0GWB2_SACKO|nr:PREDICTED: biorientation of chromosomes in cell division protein 1-like 1-like [Saccoglossus kowalevskii]